VKFPAFANPDFILLAFAQQLNEVAGSVVSLLNPTLHAEAANPQRGPSDAWELLRL